MILVGSLSVIIPATDEPATLDRCRAAIAEADDPPEEVIVVGEPRRASPAAARNRGVAESSGDVLVFVDADVLVHRDVFTRLRAMFELDPSLAAVFGSYDDRPEAPGIVSRFRNLLHHHVHQSSPGPAATFWTGLGAVRRNAFLAVDGFDADRFTRPSMEDIEFGMRLTEAGQRIELDPALQGTHLKAWSVADMVSTDFARRGVPWVRLLLERRSVSSALNLGWRHRLSTLAALAALAALASGRRRGVAVSAAALVALNRPFYALLVRRLGPAAAVAGVGLHALHLLVGAAAVPAGALAAALDPHPPRQDDAARSSHRDSHSSARPLD
jgi:GT2 family glycosyltransferase